MTILEIRNEFDTSSVLLVTITLLFDKANMITLILAGVSLAIYIFMTGFSENSRSAYFCAALMAFNWLLSEIQLYGLRHVG